MSLASFFVKESNISIYDREFYEYLKGSSISPELVKWYNNPKFSEWDIPENKALYKHLKKHDYGLPYFSFVAFSSWLIQGYWDESFQRIIKSLEYFLKPLSGTKEGKAQFKWEGGTDMYSFILDYEKKCIYVADESGKEILNFKDVQVKIPSQIKDELQNKKI